jgi:hypothetical protein
MLVPQPRLIMFFSRAPRIWNLFDRPEIFPFILELQNSA